jgi:hypothetical protein
MQQRSESYFCPHVQNTLPVPRFTSLPCLFIHLHMVYLVLPQRLYEGTKGSATNIYQYCECSGRVSIRAPLNYLVSSVFFRD